MVALVLLAIQLSAITLQTSVSTVAYAQDDRSIYVKKKKNNDCDIEEIQDSSDLPNVSPSDWSLVLVNRDNVKEEMNPNLATVDNIQVDSRIKDATEKLIAKAKEINPAFHLISGYRSVETQKTLYENYTKKEMSEKHLSKEEAEKVVQTYSQPPGSSEHMTGLAIDISTVDSLNQMSESDANALEKIAVELGFVKRFKSNYKDQTGVDNEDWHYRYVGTESSKYMTDKGLSLEKYLEQLKNKPKAKSKKSKKDGKSSGPSSESASMGDAGGDWTTPGTPSYKVAETLFKVLTEDFGLSGTSAAGWIGNVQAESGFDMAAVEAENNQSYAGRGYGLFQFTPGSKYLDSEFYKKGASQEEEIKHQVEFVWNSEFANGAYQSYLPNASSWFGLSGVDSIDDVLDNDNVENAMLIFFSVYERGDVAQMHRERRLTAAKAANSLFNTKNVKADKSKWKLSGGTSSNTATITTKAGLNEDNVDCDEDSSKDSDSGGATDGTGTVPADATAWGYKPDEVPDSLKGFIHDPAKLGMEYGGSKGWYDPGSLYLAGQCVNFTISMANIIWGHEGSVTGDGISQAQGWAGVFGNSTKTKPKAGAVFSSGSSNPGHTGIVSHVFENGDILIIEQNTPLSGADYYGKSWTWNYRIHTVAQQKADNFVFAYPDSGEPKW